MQNRFVKFNLHFKRHLLAFVLSVLGISLGGCFGLLDSAINPFPPGSGNEHRTVVSGVVHYALHSPAGTAGFAQSERDVAKHAAVPSFPTDPFVHLTTHGDAKLILQIDSIPPSGAVPPAVQALLAELGGSVDRWIGALNSLVVQLPADTDLYEAAAKFELLPEVRYAEPSQTVYPLNAPTVVPNDPDLPLQWHLEYIHMPKAWAIETGSSNVIIAVIDTGYSDHPDLPQKGNPRLVHPYSVFDGGSYFDDGSGHGVAVAGVAAATTHNQAYGAGVGWRVSVMPIRVLRRNSAGQEIGDEADVAAGIVWAVDHGAHVINLSFGIPGESRVSHIMRQAIDYAIERGVTVVAAAGNDGNNYDVVSPASHPAVIAVGAITSQGRPAVFSNTGNRSGGNPLDIVAPGTNIYTTSSRLDGASVLHRTAAFNGTSFAAPQVSGVVALLYANGILSRNMGSAAPALAQAILRESAIPLEPGKAYDDTWGYGRLDAYAALTWDTRPRLNEVHVFAGQIDSGQLHVVGDIVYPNRYGEFQMTNIPPGRHTFFAWADVDRNGRINPGDFIARLDNVLIEADKVITALHFDMRETNLQLEVIR